jgi:DNA-binding transcriptional ArsR family regulator
MEGIPENYRLENLEQLRAVADNLRLRILEQLALQAMTVTQLAGVLGEVQAKLHYHVRELEKVGLLKLVETREKGGILEKYYRSVAKNIQAPGSLFQGVPPDEIEGMLTEGIQPFFQGVVQTAQYLLRNQIWDDPEYAVELLTVHYWMTADELRQVSRQVEALLKPYQEPRGIEHEREQALLWVGSTIIPSVSEETETPGVVSSSVPLPASPPATAEPARAPKREIAIVAGVTHDTHYTRKDLERLLERGKVLDMYVLGSCTFAEDVPPDLVERLVHSFHLWGKLTASPEVRDVLKRKGGETATKSHTPS